MAGHLSYSSREQPANGREVAPGLENFVSVLGELSFGIEWLGELAAGLGELAAGLGCVAPGLGELTFAIEWV